MHIGYSAVVKPIVSLKELTIRRSKQVSRQLLRNIHLFHICGSADIIWEKKKFTKKKKNPFLP